MKTMQKHGLRVKQMRGGGQTAGGRHASRRMVGAMGQSGVTHYWIGTDNYDLTKPILPQLDAIKLKVEKFVQLNQKHGTTLMYHTRAGAGSVGSVVWDLLYVMKDFDPKHVGFHWDTGHMSHHGSNMWELLMRTAGPYVVAMGWKDRSWQQNLGFLGEGGPFPGPQAACRRRRRPAGGRGGRGAGAGAGAAGGRQERCACRSGRRSGGGGAPGGQASRRRRAWGWRRAGGRRRPSGWCGPGRCRRRRGAAVRLAASRSRWPAPRSRAAAGGRSPYVPMGTGLVDIFRYATVLRDIGFNGPMELEAEYPHRRCRECGRQAHAAARAGDRQPEARRPDDPRRVRAVRHGTLDLASSCPVSVYLPTGACHAATRRRASASSPGVIRPAAMLRSSRRPFRLSASGAWLAASANQT